MSNFAQIRYTESIGNAEKELPSRKSFWLVVVTLFREEAFDSFRIRGRAQICLEAENIWKEDNLVIFVKFWYIAREFCRSLSGYNESGNVAGIENGECFV